MDQRLSIITLGVKNLKRSEEFYINKLGWTKSEQSNEEIIFIPLNGFYLSLYKREKLAEDANCNPEGKGFKGFTLAYNAPSEQEVNDLFEKFEQLGIKIIKKPEKVFWGGYSGYIADPDNNYWEIAYNPYTSIDADGNVT